MAAEKIDIENVNHPGKTYRVDAKQYAIAREALLGLLPTTGAGLTQSEMHEAMKQALAKDHPDMKAGWWMKSAQLDLEAKGLMKRDGGKPLRWVKT